jgi:hypothetical protein
VAVLSHRLLVVGAALALPWIAAGCDDPPPDLNAGRLQTIPGDAAGGALVAAEAGVATPDASIVDAGGLDGQSADASVDAFEFPDSTDEDAFFVVPADARTDAR